MNYSKAAVAFFETGKDEITIRRAGHEPKIINKQTFEIIMAIADAKAHEHLMTDPEYNLNMMEAGVNNE